MELQKIISLLINLIFTKKGFKKDSLEHKLIAIKETINLEDKYKVKTCEIVKLFLGKINTNKRVGIIYEITDRNA